MSTLSSERFLDFLLYCLKGSESRLALHEDEIEHEVCYQQSSRWAFAPTQRPTRKEIRAGLKELKRRGCLRRYGLRRWSLTDLGVAEAKNAAAHCIECQRVYDVKRSAAQQAKLEQLQDLEAADRAAQAAAIAPSPTKLGKRSRRSPLAERAVEPVV